MRAAATRHLGEVILLRLAAQDLGGADVLEAQKHLEDCARCRDELAATRRLDRSLAKLAKTPWSEDSRSDRGPDERYFESVGRLFDVSEEGDRSAERIVQAAREGADELAAALRTLDGQPYRGFALLFEETASLPPANSQDRISTPASRQAVQAEAALFESQALLQKGEAKAAREAVRPARGFFLESGDLGFGAALCDYYEGSAASFQREYALAEKLLKRALAVFSEFGQDNLIGRAEAALGTLLSNKGDFEHSLTHYDRALNALDAESEFPRLTMAHNNRATALMRLGRFDEARATFAKALSFGRRHNHASHLFFIRTGLAELDFRRGEYGRALHAFSEIIHEASPLASKAELLFSRLYAAECQARIGSYGPMANEIEVLRDERRENPFAPSPALGELFMSLDQGTIDADLIAHVRQYLQDEENGVKRAYRPLRRANSPGS
jgi:tetratricopeptide (TPR) repeat protein